ncbi:MAG: M3 family oligoendopeptidase, partial [Chloroflexi bacterium]|nr:M3 family oligoendopeptidase [Chloroflexota bacterium]
MTQSTAAEVRWDLSDLYAAPGDPAIEADLARAAALAREFAAQYRGRVAGLSAERLRSALEAYEGIHLVAYRPAGYAGLAFSTHTQDPQRQALLARVEEAMTEIHNELVFFDVELKAATEAAVEGWLAAPALQSYHHYLRAVRVFAPHTLSEPEERLAARLNLTGASAWDRLYTEVTGSLRFPVVVDGETRELTDAEARALRTSPDRDLRRRATEALAGGYAAQSKVLTFVFNTLFQDHKLRLDIRHYAQVIEPTALENELSPEVIEVLMAACEANYELAQEYYRLKAKLLGLEGDFRVHDLMAPYTREERKYTFSEARDLVLAAYDRFSPAFRARAEEFFTRRWIDAPPVPGKRGGAFCSGMTPDLHPYVLTNFTGRLDDVFTLAHELGHGVHFALAGRQTLVNYHPTTPMAELASVFGEILLANHLRAVETDPEVRRTVVSGMVEDAAATIFRQVMYTRWEQRAHGRRAEGVATADEYSAVWLEENRRLYGDTTIFEPLDRWGWIAIPHFVHYRFYCFSYAFGHLL